jgi:hypothetical protein
MRFVMSIRTIITRAALATGVALIASPVRAGDTIDSLAADPARLRAVLQQCREDWARTGDALCNAASQAFRRRFMGPGQTPYTPHAVDMFPSLNEDGSPKINRKPKTE